VCKVPTDKTIRAWYKQFTETGCLCKQKSSGCPLTAEDDVEWVQASFVTHGAHIERLELRNVTTHNGLMCEHVCFLHAAIFKHI